MREEVKFSGVKAGGFLGPYRLIRPLRVSPLGEVFLASQRQPIRRHVAIQLLRPPDLSTTDSRRAPSRQVSYSWGLGRLQHPFIAQVFEAGETDDGQPYLVMEWVEGVPIDVYCDQAQASLAQRLRLLCCVCEGVQFAHQKGVLHGDLDPSSIFVVEVDGEPIPKIVDFAATLRAADSDLRRDVYDLGVLLYRLLVDLLPLAAGGGAATASSAPSSRFREMPTWRRARVAETRPGCTSRPSGTPRPGGTPRGLARRLRGDLDAIALKAVAEDPDQRYDSAAQLADDVRRSLDGRPVRARSGELGYGLWALVRRHQLAAGASLLVVLCLAVGIVARTLEVRRAEGAAAEALQATQETEHVVDLLGRLFEAADPEASIGTTETARALLDRGAEGLRQNQVEDLAVRAALLRTVGRVYDNLGMLDSAAELLEESLQASRILESSPGVADSLVALGKVEGERSQLGAARTHLEQALELRTDALGADHPLVADVLEQLGRISEYKGDFEVSRRTLEQALAIREMASGPRSKEVATTLDLLAVSLQGQGHFDRAERRLQLALEIWQELYGLEHPKVARSLNSLGIVLTYLERYDESEAAFRRSLAIRQRVLAPHHPDLGQSFNNLALCLLNTELHNEGMALMGKALEAWRISLGEHHPRVSTATYNLGDSYMMDSDLDAAEPLLRRALEITSQSHGPDHLQAAYPLKRMGDLMELRERFEESEGFYRRALAIREPKLNSDHPLLLGTVYGLADILRKQGREVEALDLESRFPALEVHYPEWAGESGE